MRTSGVLLLLLSLLGQSLQVMALDCVQKKNDQQLQHSLLDDATPPCHSQALVGKAKVPTESDTHTTLSQGMAMDCCDSECQCPANACNSLSALTAHSIQVVEPVASVNVLAVLATLNDPYLKSRYRPPIHI